MKSFDGVGGVKRPQKEIQRGAEISFFPQPLLKLLKVGLQSLQMGSVAPMKSPYVT